MFSSFFMFSFMFSFLMFSFLYIVHFCRIIAAALYPYLCFLSCYIVHFCRIFATALISELISHPFPSQKGVIRGGLGGYYGVIRGIFSIRCYETNMLFETLMSSNELTFRRIDQEARLIVVFFLYGLLCLCYVFVVGHNYT